MTATAQFREDTMRETASGGVRSWAEYVLHGHPDKLSDIAADALVDAYLEADPMARVACEILVGNGLIVASGQIVSRACIAIPELLRRTMRQVGYSSEDTGLDAENATLLARFSEQSESLRAALFGGNSGISICANDQTIVTGYATRNSYGMLPPASFLAKRIALAIDQSRYSGEIPLLPDGKVLVCISQEDCRIEVEKVIVSVQHRPEIAPEELRTALVDVMARPLRAAALSAPQAVSVNPPSGVFCTGGPAADTGLTGRKIIADAYGPGIPHGGGAWSGKDPTKIDRSGAYAARWVAKSIVCSGIATSALISITYVIGTSEPVDLSVRLPRGTKKTHLVKRMILDKFDLRPGAIIDSLNLRRPLYKRAAQVGHVGTDQELPWEKACYDL